MIAFCCKIEREICKLCGLNLAACQFRVLQGANFQNRSSIIMYVAGLGITYVDFMIFGVAGIGVVKGVNGAEKIAFATFGVVEDMGGVQGPAITAQLSFGVAKRFDAGEIGKTKKKKGGVARADKGSFI